MSDKLPRETILLIGEQVILSSHNKTLLRLMLASHAHYKLLSPILYCRLEVTQGDIQLIFRGLLPISSSDDNVDDSDSACAGGTYDEMGLSKVRREVRRQWSLWPDVAIPDPEHDRPLSPHSEQTGLQDGHSSGEYEATLETHKSKIKLLSCTKCITLDSLPSISASKDLLNLFPIDPGSPSSIHVPFAETLFANLQNLEFGSTFVFELSDWLNRNWITPRTDITNVRRHPFVNFLLLAFSSARSLRITYPKYSSGMKHKFSTSRYGAESTLRRCGITHEQRRRKIDSEWDMFMDEGATLALMPLIFNLKRLERVVVRCVVRSSMIPLRCGVMRIEFGRCECEIKGRATSGRAEDRIQRQDQTQQSAQVDASSQAPENSFMPSQIEVIRDAEGVLSSPIEGDYTAGTLRDFAEQRDEPEENAESTDEELTCTDHVDIERRAEQIVELIVPSFVSPLASDINQDQNKGAARPRRYEFVDAEIEDEEGIDGVEKRVREAISLDTDEELNALLHKGGLVFFRSDSSNDNYTNTCCPNAGIEQ